MRHVDVLVVGTSVAAVTSALAARAAGRSVALVSDLPYLGDDLAGNLNLWPGKLDLRDPLMTRAFAHAAGSPARPGALKSVLEEALLEADIPFLFMVRPAAVLRNAEGRLAGAILAARTSLFAITCRALVDATTHGLVATLAGIPLTPDADHPREIQWTVMGKDAPKSWSGKVEQITPVYRHLAGNGNWQEHSSYRLSLTVDKNDGCPASIGHLLRSHLVEDSVTFTAEHAVDPVRCRWAAGRDGFEAEPGLFLLGRVLPFLDVSDYLNPGTLAILGRDVGARAAGSAGSQPATGPFTAHAGGDQGGAFRFCGPFLRHNHGLLEVPEWTFPKLGQFDVVVAGGGTGGAPAGIAAAREGAGTLVIESQYGLGGVGTLGMISSYWFGNKVGFTGELNAALGEHDTLSKAKQGNTWNPAAKCGLYHRMLREAGGSAWLGGHVFGVRMDGNRVDGLLVSTPFAIGLVGAGCVVDASGNADVAAAAGAPCRVMAAQHAAVQGTGISPRVHPAVLHQNSDHTFVEENDPEGITMAQLHARRKYPNDFDTTSLVNSRERRQILGDLEVSPLDLLAERTFPDTVFTARSNFDTHGFIIHPVFMICPPDHKPLEAHVPFRCMLPRGLERVLVTGLGMSAHRDALPVIRMQADVQNQGYVAGLAAVAAVRGKCGLRELDIRKLQHRLVDLGILAADVPTHGDSFPLDKTQVDAAAANPDNARNVAVLLAHPEQSRGPLLRILRTTEDPHLKEQAALILGFQGCAEAVPFLAQWLEQHDWDEGWNYRGMGQFGLSMSRVDVFITVLARCGDDGVVPPIADKIRQLGSDAFFSHCRAVALAAACLRHPALGEALAGLLGKPGLCGHACTHSEAMRAGVNGNPTETESRNLALRELYLARGLYLCHDPEGTGARILREYSHDLRGHFARHARGVLEQGPGKLSRDEMA